MRAADSARNFSSGSDWKTARRFPRTLAPARRARLQKRRRRDGAGAGRRRRESVPGGRPVLQRAAGRVPGAERPVEERLRASRGGKRRHRAGRGVSCLASGAAAHQRRAALDSLLLGPSYGAEEIKQVLENCKLRFHYLRSTDELLATAVRMLGEHKIVAWMQGRMEFGPRALGNRSILASPLDPYSTENLNVFIKHREPFRKFAASVPAELAAEYFEVGPNARYLATVGRVRAAASQDLRIGDSGRATWCAFTPCREADNPLYHRLLHEAGQSHRPAGALQHQLQSVRRSAGLDAARRRAQLLFVGHRRAVRGEFSAGEVTLPRTREIRLNLPTPRETPRPPVRSNALPPG